MSDDLPLPGVGLPAEERFHRRYYRAAAVGRVGVLLLVVAVGLGIVGTGPFSWSEARDGDLRVTYERFARRGAPWGLEVELPVPGEGPVRVEIDAQFHRGQQLETVVPQPTSVTAAGDVVTYEFEPGSSAAVFTAAFWFQADALWRQHASVGTAGGPTVTFDQFVYP